MMLPNTPACSRTRSLPTRLEKTEARATGSMPISAGGGSNKAQKAVVNKKKGKKDDDDDDDEGSAAQKQKLKDDAAKVKAMQDKLKKK